MLNLHYLNPKSDPLLTPSNLPFSVKYLSSNPLLNKNLQMSVLPTKINQSMPYET